MMKISTEESTPSPSLSIVLAAHDQAPALRRNLPKLLAQHYEPGYEVIVVDESSTDDTEDVLKQLKATYPNLYTTYIPSSSHYISRRKLALTVGVKAAHNEWIIMIDADSYPESDHWLTSLSAHFSDDVDMVCAYTGFEEGTKSYYAYHRMFTWWWQRRSPYRCNGGNLAIRKSVFMKRNGFLKNLKYLRGEYDFLVNETAPDRIAVANEPESRMRQEAPSKRAWTNARLYYMNTRRHLRRTFVPGLLSCCFQAGLHLAYLGGFVALVLSINRQNTVHIAVSAAFLLLLYAFRFFRMYCVTKMLGEKIALWKLPFLELENAWSYIRFWLKYQLSDKTDFVRK